MNTGNKLIDAVVRAASESLQDKLIYGVDRHFDYYFTVEEWLLMDDCERKAGTYPNAKKATELKKSKLYKALK